jgi:NAD(P)-dependent dehydrogenase (short-subunit alcohol dehydrogenase family)
MNADSQPVAFRSGLLEGEVVVVAGAGPFGSAAAAACTALGAAVSVMDADGLDEDAVAEEVRAIAARDGGVGILVVDAAARFAETDPQLDPMRAAADAAWLAARSVATGAMIDAQDGGKIVFVAPAPDAGPHAGVARAALENLARTLSIEWSRHTILPTAILPGARTTDDEIGGLVAYLASPAGDYFSGCVFSLGGP